MTSRYGRVVKSPDMKRNKRIKPMTREEKELLSGLNELVRMGLATCKKGKYYIRHGVTVVENEDGSVTATLSKDN